MSNKRTRDEIEQEMRATKDKLEALEAEYDEAPDLKYKVGDKVFVELTICGLITKESPEGYQYKAKRESGDGFWICLKEPDILGNAQDTIEWHNPDNLTPDQVGEGYRLLTKKEQRSIGDSLEDGFGEICDCYVGEGWVSGYYGSIEDSTYRVRAKKYPIGSLEIK